MSRRKGGCGAVRGKAGRLSDPRQGTVHWGKTHSPLTERAGKSKTVFSDALLESRMFSGEKGDLTVEEKHTGEKGSDEMEEKASIGCETHGKTETSSVRKG